MQGLNRYMENTKLKSYIYFRALLSWWSLSRIWWVSCRISVPTLISSWRWFVTSSKSTSRSATLPTGDNTLTVESISIFYIQQTLLYESTLDSLSKWGLKALFSDPTTAAWKSWGWNQNSNNDAELSVFTELNIFRSRQTNNKNKSLKSGTQGHYKCSWLVFTCSSCLIKSRFNIFGCTVHHRVNNFLICYAG